MLHGVKTHRRPMPSHTKSIFNDSQPRSRHDAAVRSLGGQSLRSRIRDHLQKGHAGRYLGRVTRTGWNGGVWGANQRITVDEALRINTLNGAYATREESIKGSIAPGKLADFVVLSEDPHAVDPSKIKDIEVVRTVVGGGTSYRA